MPGLPPIPLLLFAQARIEAMPSSMPTVEVVEAAGGLPVAWMILLTFTTIAIAIVACLALRSAKRRKNDNWHLFKELCRANQLSRSQCRALRRLSKQLQIANPSRLFLEIDLWNLKSADSTPIDSEPTSPNPHDTGKAYEELCTLSQRLFAPVA